MGDRYITVHEYCTPKIIPKLLDILAVLSTIIDFYLLLGLGGSKLGVLLQNLIFQESFTESLLILLGTAQFSDWGRSVDFRDDFTSGATFHGQNHLSMRRYHTVIFNE